VQVYVQHHSGRHGFPDARLFGARWESDVRAPAEEESGAVWGYRITVAPRYPEDLNSVASLREKFMQHVASQQVTCKIVHAFVLFDLIFNVPLLPLLQVSIRSGSLDAHLVRYVNTACRKRGVNKTSLLGLDWAGVAPKVEELVAWPVIAEALATSPSTPTSVSPRGPMSPDGGAWEEEKADGALSWVVGGSEGCLEVRAEPSVDARLLAKVPSARRMRLLGAHRDTDGQRCILLGVLSLWHIPGRAVT
jgi:hypothetical protein